MSRSDLLDLLPDFSSGHRRHAPARAPGFEPLVQDAGAREEFSALGMPSGFAGLSGAPDPGAIDDPFAGDPGLVPEIGIGDDPPSLDLSDLAPVAPGPVAGLSTEEPIGLTEESPAGEPADRFPDIAVSEDIGLDGEPEDTATGITAHELLEAAHRAELNDLKSAHRKEIEELVSVRIPGLRDEVADAIADELAPLLATVLRAEQAARTLDALVAEVAAVLRDSDAVGFELRGPQDLLAAFEEKWSQNDAPARLVPAEGVDLVARIDKTVIATRLSEIDRLIQEALS